MKPVTRLQQLCIFVSIFPWILSSQNDTLPKINNHKLYFATHVFLGKAVTNGYKPEGAFSANIQFQGEERFGFGLDITLINPESKGFTKNPPAQFIKNYTEGIDEPYAFVNANGAPYQDHFSSFSFYISKGIKLRERFVIDFQAGFSLFQMKRNSYTYKYFPRTSGGFASFFGSGSRPPFVLVNKVSGSSTFNLGFYFRVNGIVRFRKRTVIEVSPFAQLNGKQSFFGVQLGIGFGRAYKLNILK